MDHRRSAMFFAFYFFLLNMITVHDMQRAALLASLIQIRALQLQLTLIWSQHRRQTRRKFRGRRIPRSWVLPRPHRSWFDIHYFDQTIPDDYFRRQLCISRNTFTMLLNILRPRLTRQNTYMRDCVTPEKILAIGLYRLAHGISYVTTGFKFNVGKTTVYEAVQDVVDALCGIKEEYIKFPFTNQEIFATRQTFEGFTNLPNVVGAIDVTHIQIKNPTETGTDYFSRLDQHDVVVQAVVDGEKRFLDVATGFPGSMPESRVLMKSSLYQRIMGGELLTEQSVKFGGRDIRAVLVGNSAYPLFPWLLKPYHESTNDPLEINFNKQLSSARELIECAFGLLKGRWRILQKRLDSNVAFTNHVITACCVLHNFCINTGDVWNKLDRDNDSALPARDQNSHGEDLRDFLKEQLWNV